jgi:hypothetical protein
VADDPGDLLDRDAACRQAARHSYAAGAGRPACQSPCGDRQPQPSPASAPAQQSAPWTAGPVDRSAAVQERQRFGQRRRTPLRGG